MENTPDDAKKNATLTKIMRKRKKALFAKHKRK